jgi:hypothetical protein
MQPVTTGTEQADCCQSNSLAARIESARQIIDDSHELKHVARQCHKDAELLIAQSQKLKGEARELETLQPHLPPSKSMSPAQLRQATGQYQADLNAFQKHAQAYDGHLKQFQLTVGECHSGEKMFDNILNKYALHVGQFHMSTSTIRPPHICGVMKRMIDRDYSQISSSLINDQMRILSAENDLQRQEARLQNAEQANVAASAKAINQAKREEGEQSLASEFGRLKEECDLLQFERNRLIGTNQNAGSVKQTSVSGVLKGH